MPAVNPIKRFKITVSIVEEYDYKYREDSEIEVRTRNVELYCQETPALDLVAVIKAVNGLTSQ